MPSTRFCFVVLIWLFSSSCSLLDLKGPRNDGKRPENILSEEEINNARAESIRDNETYYTRQLKCMEISAFSATKKPIKPIFAVDNVFDETGKLYAPKVPAISHMIQKALIQVKGIEVLETPFYDISTSRTDVTQLTPRRGAEISKQLHAPVGTLFPSNFYITGAMVEYDESSQLPVSIWRIVVDFFSFRREVVTTTIGIDLRLVNSKDGTVVYNSKSGKRGAVTLRSRFFRISQDTGGFKIVNENARSVDHSVIVQEPKYYAVREMAEKGVVELLSIFGPSQSCQS